MSNASLASKYSEITIDKDGRRVALEGKTVSFSYYESIFFPHITANLVYVDTGGGIEAESDEDTQERRGTIINSLPIRGNEKLEFLIEGKLGSLDFIDYPLYVVSASPVGQESLRETVIVNLASEFGIKNRGVTVYKKYYNNISNSVSTILTSELGVPSTRTIIDSCQNSCAFTGSGKNPFDLINSLCPRAIPTSGGPGFLFWENQDGFNFRAIDNLISSSPVQTYRYYGIAKSSFNNDDNDYRILTYTVTKNQNILDALAAGVYRTKNVFFNPYDFTYDEVYLSLSDSGLNTLGNDIEYPEDFDSYGSFTRTNHFILNTGNMEVGISTTLNNDPKQYHAKAIMRYNLLMVQVINMTVPFNPNLKAGNIINCEFEKISTDNKNEGSIDESQSGKYMIANLCHSLDPKRSFTSLTVIRDTYGIYTSGG